MRRFAFLTIELGEFVGRACLLSTGRLPVADSNLASKGQTALLPAVAQAFFLETGDKDDFFEGKLRPNQDRRTDRASAPWPLTPFAEPERPGTGSSPTCDRIIHSPMKMPRLFGGEALHRRTRCTQR